MDRPDSEGGGSSGYIFEVGHFAMTTLILGFCRSEGNYGLKVMGIHVI